MRASLLKLDLAFLRPLISLWLLWCELVCSFGSVSTDGSDASPIGSPDRASFEIQRQPSDDDMINCLGLAVFLRKLKKVKKSNGQVLAINEWGSGSSSTLLLAKSNLLPKVSPLTPKHVKEAALEASPRNARLNWRHIEGETETILIQGSGSANYHAA
ncbi:hypothetical protein ACE6H2_026476 [Prunus campanulata]